MSEPTRSESAAPVQLMQRVWITGVAQRPVFGPPCPTCGRTDYPHICIVTVKP